MYFRRKTADYFRSNFSSIQTLILRFGYLWVSEIIWGGVRSVVIRVGKVIVQQAKRVKWKNVKKKMFKKRSVFISLKIYEIHY